MILVDTSIWIPFLAGRSPYASELDRLLSLEEVSAHPLVYGELLIGDTGSRANFLDLYGAIHQSASVPHNEVVQFVRHRKLEGRGIGWIDIHLLASAVVANLPLWTADANLSALAATFHLAHQPSASASQYH